MCSSLGAGLPGGCQAGASIPIMNLSTDGNNAPWTFLGEVF